jgi:hypothetical protein
VSRRAGGGPAGGGPAVAPIAGLLLALPLAVAGGAPTAADTYPIVLFRALDKVTARSTTIEAAIDQTVTFRTLHITPRVCDKRPPEEKPEAAAFLDITEVREGRPDSTVFRGWMFASSPGLSPMQHPVYDVWILDCLDTPESAKAREVGESAADSAPENAAGSGSR